MKHPKDMTTEGLIELADEIKRGTTKRLFSDMEFLNKVKEKKSITKDDAIKIADIVKSGMSIKVLHDLEELKTARSKVLMAEQS